MKIMSDDHVFSDFLGGKATILACKKCNSRFGHQFEGKVFSGLTPYIVILAINGMPIKKRLVWKNAHFHDGVHYDLDSDNKSMARPQPILSLEGKFSGFKATLVNKYLKKALKSLTHKGHKITEIQEEITINKKLIPPPFHFDDNMKRLAIKMCVGLLKYFNVTITMDHSAFEFLHKGFSVNPPVYIDFRPLQLIELHRSNTLSHLVYVEGNSKSGKCYGVVQIFGFFQMYVVISDEYDGEEFAFIGMHNSVTHDENFQRFQSIGIEMPPTSLPHDFIVTGCKSMFEKLNKLMDESFGKCIVFFDLSAMQVGP